MNKKYKNHAIMTTQRITGFASGGWVAYVFDGPKVNIRLEGVIHTTQPCIGEDRAIAKARQWINDNEVIA